MKRFINIAALTIALIMAFVTAGCTGGGATATVPAGTADIPTESVQAEKPYQQRTRVRIGVLNGPTGMGAVRLMQDNKEENTLNRYDFQQFSAPTDILPLLIKGELDIAAVPTNLAATLYNKTKGGVKLLALNTLGVLYVLSRDERVKSLSDLEGRKVVISGQGSTPEYAFDYILDSNGIKDKVNVEFAADHSSLVAMCAAGTADTVVLPEPFATVLLSKNIGFNRCIDLNKEWDSASRGQSIFSMGCLVVRAEFAQQQPEAVADFLNEYGKSVEYVNADNDSAAQLIKEFGIVADAEIAKAALPQCNIVCIDGQDMKAKTDAFLKLMHGYNPQSVGGSVPGDDFYYEAE